MTAQVSAASGARNPDRRVEYCPQARADAFFENGRCQFCKTDHKLASQLTADHRKVMRMLANGDTPQQIANQLGVKYNTLHHRLREVRLILNAKTMSHAVALLAREGSL